MSQIDINQRIPLSVLELALKSHLEDCYDTEYLKEQLSFEYSGANRIAKALRLINKVVLRNPMSEILFEYKQEVLNSLKSKGDKSVILISLLNSAFPFSFNTLCAFAKYFEVQQFVNWELIQKEIQSKYGSNRSTQNALYSVIPMFIEAEFFLRTKPGLYESKEKIVVQSQIAHDLYTQSFLMNNPLFQDSVMLDHEPYFGLVEFAK